MFISRRWSRPRKAYSWKNLNEFGFDKRCKLSIQFGCVLERRPLSGLKSWKCCLSRGRGGSRIESWISPLNSLSATGTMFYTETIVQILYVRDTSITGIFSRSQWVYKRNFYVEFYCKLIRNTLRFRAHDTNWCHLLVPVTWQSPMWRWIKIEFWMFLKSNKYSWHSR